MPTLSELPPTARLVLRPIHPPLAREAATALTQAIDKLFSQFVREDRVSAHAVEVLADGAVLAVAFVDGTPLSGCSHDKLAQVLTAHEARTGAKLLDAPPIMVEVDGRPTCVDRVGLKGLIAAGRVDANTIHWDLRADTIGVWREHGRRPARDTWLAPLIARAQTSGTGG
ncbi:MAG TPA: hypothetical protein VHX44_15990 [Planctomycetota bacterium]|nr:hypothetical protein [Planctomycetota bacterium]